MAAPPTVRYASAVVIDSTNGTIRADDSGVAFDAVITPDTYFLTGDTSAANDLMAAIEAALDNDGADDWAVRYNSDGSVGFKSVDGTWSIDWDHANTTLDGTILGIADTSAAFGAAADTYADTDYHTKHRWDSTQAVASDSGVDGEEQQENSASQTRAKSGAVWTVKLGGPYDVRAIGHAWEPVAKAYPAATPVNASWIEFMRTTNSGETVRYYPDTTATTVYFAGVFDEATINDGAKPARLSAGVELYSWSVRMLGCVA